MEGFTNLYYDDAGFIVAVGDKTYSCDLYAEARLCHGNLEICAEVESIRCADDGRLVTDADEFERVYEVVESRLRNMRIDDWSVE